MRGFRSMRKYCCCDTSNRHQQAFPASTTLLRIRPKLPVLQQVGVDRIYLWRLLLSNGVRVHEGHAMHAKRGQPAYCTTHPVTIFNRGNTKASIYIYTCSMVRSQLLLSICSLKEFRECAIQSILGYKNSESLLQRPNFGTDIRKSDFRLRTHVMATSTLRAMYHIFW